MRRLAGWILLAGLMVTLPAAFAEPATEAGAHKGGEAEGEGTKTLVLKWVNFAMLAGALGYLIKKNAGPYFANRGVQIRKGMIEAEELRANAEARMAAVDAKLSSLKAEVEALQKDARAEAEAEGERARREVAAELAKIQANATQEIASLGKTARLELKRYAAQSAIALAEQKIRARINPENQALLIRQFVKDMAHPAQST